MRPILLPWTILTTHERDTTLSTKDQGAPSRTPVSRLDLVQQFAEGTNAPPGLSVNIGCKETSIGDVNLDIAGSPDVKGSVLSLPFKRDVFSVAIFSEVMEHLPLGKELQALGEICRVLKGDGVLILSTPSSEGPWGKLYWIFDPTFWLIGHRHYSEARLMQLLDKSGFSIEMATRRGGTRDLLFSLITPVVYMLKKLGISYSPDLNSDYSLDSSSKGYTFVVQARKLGIVHEPTHVSQTLSASQCHEACTRFDK